MEKACLIKLTASAPHIKEIDVASIYAHEGENGKENNVYKHCSVVMSGTLEQNVSFNPSTSMYSAHNFPHLIDEKSETQRS